MFPPASQEPLLLSPSEQGFWRGSIRAALLLRLEGILESRLLVEALRRLQRRHPKLRARVVQDYDGRERYHFDDGAAPIPLEITDYDHGDLRWREEMSRLVSAPSPPLGPLAAVCLLRCRPEGYCLLLLAVHHGVADGGSLLLLVDDLLSAYATLEERFDSPPPDILPAISPRRVNASAGWRNQLRLARRFLKLQRQEQRSPLTVPPPGRDVPVLSQWVHWVFTRQETLGITSRCRQEHVSFSAAMVAAVWCGLMDCLDVPEGLFKWHCPIDVRRFLEDPAGAGALGSLSTMMRGVYRVPKHPVFWDVARRAHQDLSSFIEWGGPAFGYNATAVATRSWFSRAEPMLLPSNDRRPTLLGTNYGVVNLRDVYGSLRPTACTLIFTGDHLTGPRLIMEALVLSRRLNIGFAADAVEPAFWKRLQEAVRYHLNTALQPNAPMPSNA